MNNQSNTRREPQRDSMLDKYYRAYDYYTASCARSNEEPVPFNVYLMRMPQSDVEHMIRLYNL